MSKKVSYLNLIAYCVLWLIFLVGFVASLFENLKGLYNVFGIIYIVLFPILFIYSFVCVFVSRKDVINRKYYPFNIMVSVLYLLMLTLAIIVL